MRSMYGTCRQKHIPWYNTGARPVGLRGARTGPLLLLLLTCGPAAGGAKGLIEPLACLALLTRVVGSGSMMGAKSSSGRGREHRGGGWMCGHTYYLGR
jgi:hypothetical protein